MTKKLSEEVKLRRLIRRSIESKVNFLNGAGREQYWNIVSEFLERFFLCEIGTKKALANYYKKKGDDKKAKDVNMPLTDIENALKIAGYSIDSTTLFEIFKRNKNRNEKSARDLRNSIVHDMSPDDTQELVNRWDSIKALLDSYLAVLTSEPL